MPLAPLLILYPNFIKFLKEETYSASGLCAYINN